METEEILNILSFDENLTSDMRYNLV